MVLENILNDPLLLSGTIGVVGVFGGIAVYQKLTNQSDDRIEPEGLEKKFKKIFRNPVKTQGSKVKDFVKIRGTSNTPRLLGLAYTAKDANIKVVIYDQEEEEYKEKTSKGTIYNIIEGSSEFDVKLKSFFYSLTGFNSMVETYDVPKKLLTVGDEYIWLDNSSHFVKFNGVKRHMDVEGLSRGWEASFSKTHENYIETMGDIPEQYSVLNNRINGQLQLENTKSKNFRKFEELKSDMEKMDAME